MGGLKEAADALLGQAAGRGDIPGVVAIATGADGAFYSGAFGVRSLDSGAAMTTDTVVWIASLTKAVTGACAMKLVESGRLDLDAPAGDLIPWLGEAPVLDGFGADGQPRLRKARTVMTLRHLLTHTAGFGYDFWSADLKRCNAATGQPSIRTRTVASLQQPLLFDPGTDWMYGINIEWAGQLVEAVSGMTLGAFARQNLFEPLGMDSTAFDATPAMKERQAAMHNRTGSGLAQAAPAAPSGVEPEIEMGGGGLFSTMEDYACFVRLFLNDGRGPDGGPVLKPETVDMMARNQMGDHRVKLLRTTDTAVTLDAEFFPGLEKTWGLTFMINEADAPTGRPAGSLAWAGLANSYYWIDRKNGIGGVWTTQLFPFCDEKALPLYLDFEKTVYDHLGAGAA
ncbi:MAG: serine hydrolase domain-containing protein [Minwuia sp.]|uniref:serine hydrolase domain-containing protein n=1 Tax=Minwuia sp. TaxID=2493630 RepID=UPI003A839867